MSRYIKHHSEDRQHEITFPGNSMKTWKLNQGFKYWFPFSKIETQKCANSQRILSRLINKRQAEVYFLTEWPRGNKLDGNQHRRNKIEMICYGAVLRPNNDLQDLIWKHNPQEKFLSLTPGSSSRSNVVKELWTKKGVTFLGSGPICQPSKYSIPLPTQDQYSEHQIFWRRHGCKYLLSRTK